ncbi:hypothetical protein [Marinobacter sp. SS21]|uniref:hypothetical protein n=1 Tax=Marinobacter sp. SS21 TaxID=2979460 RepID=UPI00232CC6CF|nr:hypothetical protein [Marinobacter sp. SS21]MDC0663251.1 hypothetical protein [Marinobacter sp. SS21]
MRWLVFLLIAVNLGVWWYLQSYPDPNPEPAEVDGRLPRVAELQLVEELSLVPQASDSKSDAVPEPATVAATSPEPSRLCFAVGWFESPELAQEQKAALGLARPGLDIKVASLERPLAPLHWVIVPPQASVEEALTLFRYVQRRGIDSYLVTEGPQKHAISLGLFESRTAAERVLAQRKAENLNAELAFFPRNQLSYALVFEAAYSPDSPELAADMAELGRQFESIEIKSCEGVATAEKSP